MRGFLIIKWQQWGGLLFLLGAAVPTLASDSQDFVLRWPQEGYIWHYNPANAPDWISPEEGLALVRAAAQSWAPCGVALRFAGLTDKLPGIMDGTNVVGWKNDSRSHSAWTAWRAHREGRALEADITLYANIFDEYRRRHLDAPLELRKSIIHEFGHVLVRPHSDRLGDVMMVKVRTRPEWQLPSENDLAVCKRLHP